MKKLGCAGAIAAVLLIVFFFTPVGTMLKLGYKHGALKRRADLPAIAREMASFLSDDPPRTLRATDPDYPASLKKLGALRICASRRAP